MRTRRIKHRLDEISQGDMKIGKNALGRGACFLFVLLASLLPDDFAYGSEESENPAVTQEISTLVNSLTLLSDKLSLVLGPNNENPIDLTNARLVLGNVINGKTVLSTICGWNDATSKLVLIKAVPLEKFPPQIQKKIWNQSLRDRNAQNNQQLRNTEKLLTIHEAYLKATQSDSPESKAPQHIKRLTGNFYNFSNLNLGGVLWKSAFLINSFGQTVAIAGEYIDNGEQKFGVDYYSANRFLPGYAGILISKLDEINTINSQAPSLLPSVENYLLSYSSRKTARPTELEVDVVEPSTPQAPSSKDIVGSITSRGIVAKNRTAIYYLEGADITAPEKEIAQKGFGGKLLGHVKTGFVAREMGRYNAEGGCVIKLLKPISGQTYVYANRADFRSLSQYDGTRRWWNTDSSDNKLPSLVSLLGPDPPQIEDYPVTPGTLVNDSSGDNIPILQNGNNAITKAWRINGLVPSNQTQLGLVETANGYFFGYISDRNQQTSQSITWEEFIQSKDKPFSITKIASTQLGPSKKICDLVNFSSTNRNLNLTANPSSARLDIGKLSTILDSGLDGYLAENLYDASKDFEPISKLSEETSVSDSYAFSIQTLTEKATLFFKSRTPASTILEINLNQKERQVEATKTTIKATPWKLKKASKSIALANDSDGSVRFTDGAFIYAIDFNNMSAPILNKYEVVKNNLWKAGNR